MPLLCLVLLYKISILSKSIVIPLHIYTCSWMPRQKKRTPLSSPKKSSATTMNNDTKNAELMMMMMMMVVLGVEVFHFRLCVCMCYHISHTHAWTTVPAGTSQQTCSWWSETGTKEQDAVTMSCSTLQDLNLIKVNCHSTSHLHM